MTLEGLSRRLDSFPNRALFLLLSRGIPLFLLGGSIPFLLLGWGVALFLLSRSVPFLLFTGIAGWGRCVARWCGSITRRSTAPFHLGFVVRRPSSGRSWGWSRSRAAAITAPDRKRHQTTSCQHRQLLHVSLPCCLNCSEGRLADDLRWIHLVTSGRTTRYTAALKNSRP